MAPLYGDREAASVADVLLADKYGADSRKRLMDGGEEFERAEELQVDLTRLLSWEPVQYVVGFAEFYGRRFEVNSSTLIPRVETEQMVREMVETGELEGKKILDVGTGSGVIAITLALELPDAEVTAWDISIEALEVARRNAARLGAKVKFEQRDILNDRASEAFDCVVSNPPYVLESDKAAMRENVVRFEPEGALYVPDADPLRFYRAILQRVETREVWFEIHERYAREMESLMREFGLGEVRIIRDIHGKERIATGK